MNDELVRITNWEQSIARELDSQWTIRAFELVGSTMDIARNSLESNSPLGPSLVLARSQGHGRGRQGRRWESNEGGFYGTYVFRSSVGAAQFSGFSLAAGIAVLDALSLEQGSVGLKWPNDIMTADGRKLGGILVELVSRGTETFVLTGIGLNLTEPPESIPESGSLAPFLGQRSNPVYVASVLSPKLLRTFQDFVSRSFSLFRDAFLSRALLLHTSLSIDVGGEILKGEYQGVSNTGAMLLRTDAGEREISSGHILNTVFVR